MTPAAYRETLARLRLSQARLARMLDVDKNTPNRWGTGAAPVPGAVAILLGVLDQGLATVEDLESLAEVDRA